MTIDGLTQIITEVQNLQRDPHTYGRMGGVRPKGEGNGMEDRANIIKIICEALSSGDKAGASEIARRQYPFLVPPAATREFTEALAFRVFVRFTRLFRRTDRLSLSTSSNLSNSLTQ